jgi:hypothetical protein
MYRHANTVRMDQRTAAGGTAGARRHGNRAARLDLTVDANGRRSGAAHPSK